MATNIYAKAKRGNLNYKEKKYISAIEKKISEKPELSAKIKTATNIEELKELHDQVIAETVDFIDMPAGGEEKEVKGDAKPNEPISNENTNSNSKNTSEKNEIAFDDSDFTDGENTPDPLNEKEPVVRDYVLKDDMHNPETQGTQQQTGQTVFEEPVTFGQAFDMPQGNEEPQSAKNDNNQQNSGQQKQQKKEPLNPSFNDMNAGKKKRSTRRFAKFIVNTVCALTEFGFVWYATNEIDEAKLAEYEINGEVDLTLLVTLEDGQEATVKQFFQAQCKSAEELAKITAQEKEELIDTLAEVLLAKGIAPTPEQELLLQFGEIIIAKGILIYKMKVRTNSVLDQLRKMKVEEVPHEEVKEEKKNPPPPPPAEPEQKNENPVTSPDGGSAGAEISTEISTTVLKE